MKDEIMERHHLKETLTELHQELAAAQTAVDSETKTLLRQLAADIDRICDLEPPVDAVDEAVPVEKEGLLDQLLNLTEEFEESHPKLADVIGRVATALSRIGI